MKSVLSRLLSRPEAQEIVGEWARQIKKGRDPSVFANFYLEVMRSPENDALRKDASELLTFASSRNWDEMLEELKPAIDKTTLPVFKLPSANTFYEGWVMMVRMQVEAYFNGEMKKAKAEKSRKKKTG